MNVCIKNLEMTASKSNNFGENEWNSHVDMQHHIFTYLLIEQCIYKVDKMEYYLAAETA
jgi:hypothetical protein